jgi:hypothetical protein
MPEAYREPAKDLRQVSDDELYGRLARSTRNSWQYHHTEVELLRRQNRRTERRGWVAIGISILAFFVSAVTWLTR